MICIWPLQLILVTEDDTDADGADDPSDADKLRYSFMKPEDAEEDDTSGIGICRQPG